MAFCHGSLSSLLCLLVPWLSVFALLSFAPPCHNTRLQYSTIFLLLVHTWFFLSLFPWFGWSFFLAPWFLCLGNLVW
ncbi:hypothetical protein M758_11G038300 [Ceratodon purpureus]|nr:hypothetical protein M758_11G038300 [Ceratodon purpureus]